MFKKSLIKYFNQIKLYSNSNQINISKATKKDGIKIIQLLCDNFLREDPLVKGFTIKTNNSVLIDMWITQIKNGMALKAVTNQNIVGVSLNCKNLPWDGVLIQNYANLSKCFDTKKLLNIWSVISKEPDLHKKYSTKVIFEVCVLGTLKKEILLVHIIDKFSEGKIKIDIFFF